MKRKRNYCLIFGIIITAVILAAALLGLFWTPYSPTEINGDIRLCAPSLAHPFGTDNYGRDILSRVMKGAGTTFFVAVLTIIFGMIAGCIIGFASGYIGGWFDEVVMRIVDVLNAFPGVLLALVLVSILGSGLKNIIIALGILFIPGFARIARSEMLRLKGLPFVQSARLSKAGPLKIIFGHIMPNAYTSIFSSAAIYFNSAVLSEASLSYLGLGVSPPTASLGLMISEAGSYLLVAPWYAVFPGVTIIVLILGVSLISEGITRIE